MESDDLLKSLHTKFIVMPHDSGSHLYEMSSTKGPFYIISEDSSSGVAVKLDETMEFYEETSNIVLEAEVLWDTPFLTLKTTYTSAESMNFALICTAFVESMNDVKVDPGGWIDKWKDLLGNKNQDRQTYPVIGELCVVKDCLDHGIEVVWQGPESKVVDVVSHSPPMNIEVKSSTTINKDVIKISEEFQGDMADYICYCKFQEVGSGGISIASMVNSLVDDYGWSRDELKEKITRLGVKNTRQLSQEYQLLEKKYYRTGDNLPNLKEYFDRHGRPKNLGKVEYEVVLNGMEGLEFPPLDSDSSQ